MPVAQFEYSETIKLWSLFGYNKNDKRLPSKGCLEKLIQDVDSDPTSIYGGDMKCPNCQNRKIDVYEARGYTSKESPIKECDCGHVWRHIPLEGDNKRIDTIRQGRKN